MKISTRITRTNTGLPIQSKIKAGAVTQNHSQTGLAVRTLVKAGSITSNHNQSLRSL